MSYAGTIAYCSREDHWSPWFGRCLAALTKRHPDAKLVHVVGNRIDEQRNECVRQMEGGWLFSIDTDMMFSPFILSKLLHRLSPDVQVVQGHCLKRSIPHEPIPQFGLYDGRTGLVPAQWLGAGGTLYTAHALSTIGAPWFEGVCGLEDVYCCDKLKRAGFTLWCDLDATIGHIMPIAVMPWRAGNGWFVGYEDLHGNMMPQGYGPSAKPGVFVSGDGVPTGRLS